MAAAPVSPPGAAVRPRVLLADDDRAIRDSLTTALRLDGYAVSAVPDGIEALAVGREQQPDVYVLDVMMPGLDGLKVCEVLRAAGDRTPILMLTARVETADRVAGLDAGADDYLAKPFDLDELLARLRALLRRAALAPAFGPGGPDDDSHVIEAGGVRVDPLRRQVWRDGVEVELSKTEFDLLELLVRNAGIVLDHSTIYDRIWGYDFGPESKNLAVYISYLRRKLNAPGDELIRTVRGVGYSLRP